MRKRVLLLTVAILLSACASRPPLPPRALSLNDAGVAALGAGDLQTAEARFTLATEYGPRFTEAWVNLGLVELRRGNLQLAYKRFDRARDLNPDLPTPHHSLGLLAEKRNLVAEAERHYALALRVDPGFVPARQNLGRLLFARRAFDAAKSQFLRLTEVAPRELGGHLGLVECLFRLHREGEADEALSRARRLLGDIAELRLLVGRQLLHRGNYAEAEAMFAGLTASADPRVAGPAWALVSVARLGKGDAGGAEKAAAEALRVDRDDPVATYTMAMALLARGDHAAQAYLQRARAMGSLDQASFDRLRGPSLLSARERARQP